MADPLITALTPLDMKRDEHSVCTAYSVPLYVVFMPSYDVMANPDEP